MAKVKPPDPPQVVVIAVPNGAGKTSYAESILAVMCVYNFVNADRIAQGLSGIHPELVAIQAGRIMLERTDDYGRGSMAKTPAHRKEELVLSTPAINRALAKAARRVHLINTALLPKSRRTSNPRTSRSR